MRVVTSVLLAAALGAPLVPAQPIPAQPGTAPTAASSKPQAVVSFQFDRTGLAVPRYTLELHEDGTGSYKADQIEIPAKGTSTRGQAAQHIDRSINLSHATVEKIFKAARAQNYFNVDCDSKAKNIANTGKKTLTYTGPDGSGSCTYNYSENKSVAALTDIFFGIADTLDEGRTLEFLHKYDRLGLDAEMISFEQDVQSGRALELGTIAPTLASIADDGALIQRVRLRAQKMLEQVAAENH